VRKIICSAKRLESIPMKMKAILQSCVVSAALVSPAFSQTAPDIRGYWAGGYT
jgi:hypothetical protein